MHQTRYVFAATANLILPSSANWRLRTGTVQTKVTPK